MIDIRVPPRWLPLTPRILELEVGDSFDLRDIERHRAHECYALAERIGRRVKIKHIGQRHYRIERIA